MLHTWEGFRLVKNQPRKRWSPEANLHLLTKKILWRYSKCRLARLLPGVPSAWGSAFPCCCCSRLAGALPACLLGLTPVGKEHLGPIWLLWWPHPAWPLCLAWVRFISIACEREGGKKNLAPELRPSLGVLHEQSFLWNCWVFGLVKDWQNWEA